ncbi:MAG: hypothetical protein ACJAV6_000150 [Candidatus Paceibacteria bacterium]|jgi:hypothetical protein
MNLDMKKFNQPINAVPDKLLIEHVSATELFDTSPSQDMAINEILKKQVEEGNIISDLELLQNELIEKISKFAKEYAGKDLLNPNLAINLFMHLIDLEGSLATEENPRTIKYLEEQLVEKKDLYNRSKAKMPEEIISLLEQLESSNKKKPE